MARARAMARVRVIVRARARARARASDGEENGKPGHREVKNRRMTAAHHHKTRCVECVG